ncbi:hypothetical protein ULG90_02560 [Halopseudomonas pachastrellae]|nr:hypothetical protein ULG90_02560 [Halopseudomonas pachastrellae]
MYQSKGDGGRAFRFYAPAMNERQQRLLAMESELHRALERDEFVVYYQPQADLATGQGRAPRRSFAGGTRNAGWCRLMSLFHSWKKPA